MARENPFDAIVGDFIEKTRDAQRPPIELVLEVMESAFDDMEIAVRKDHDGPDMWMWADLVMAETGMPKFYILSRSNMPGTEGYPMITIRQAYSVRLDTWIVMSALVVGPDENGISHSLAVTLANHAGAFAVVRFAAGAMAAAHGNPQAGIPRERECDDGKVRPGRHQSEPLLSQAAPVRVAGNLLGQSRFVQEDEAVVGHHVHLRVAPTM